MHKSEEFRAAIVAAGLTPPDAIEAGKFHKFPGMGKRNGNTAAWCKLFPDGMGGVYGDYSTGLSDDWKAKREKPLSAIEREAFKRQVAEARKQAEAEQAQRHAEAAIKAAGIWSAALPAPDNHSYLVNKGIKAHGAKFDGRCLVIPALDSGVLHSVQTIDTEGDKRFMPGGRVTGCYYPIGKPDGVLCIAEGFATGASIHEATGGAVAVAFNAGNLAAVATAMREKFPDIRLVLCADDDHRTPGNPGLTKATEAARAVGGLLAIPDFGSDRPDAVSDFNDLAKHRGEEAVKQAIQNASAPPMPAYQPGRDNATAGVVEGGKPESLFDVVARLAKLSPLEYEQVRDTESQSLGVRVGALDKEVSNGRRERQEEGGKTAMFPDVELWPDPVNGDALLNELVDTVHRFIICERETAIAAALWCALTWIIDRVQVSPIALIKSPEKRCGKSQLLTLIGRLSRRPLVASNISPAAVFRVIEAHGPTLILDEADSFMKENEELRGVINSGHTRQAAYVIRTVGDDFEPRQFSTWGAKAIAGIGALSETVMDRSIVLDLRRKLPGESVQRLRHAEPGLFDRLASKLARFAEDAGPAIERARPMLPDALNDRAQDNWETLLAIADHAGGEWPKIARHAALKLSGAEQESVSLSAELLADIQEVFQQKRVDRLSTADLLQYLTSDDLKPWATYCRGKPMTARQLAKRLEEYGVASQNIRIGYSDVKKGFLLDQFTDAFARYLTPPHSTPGILPLSATSEHQRGFDRSGNVAVADSLPLHATFQQQKPFGIEGACSVVADSKSCRYKSATLEPAPVLACSVVAAKGVFSGEGVGGHTPSTDGNYSGDDSGSADREEVEL